MAWHRRHKEFLTLLMIDLDHFKDVNDLESYRERWDLVAEFLRQGPSDGAKSGSGGHRESDVG